MSWDASKRPIAATLEGWRREVEGIQNYLREQEELPQQLKLPWVEGTTRYYRARLKYLLRHKPAARARRKGTRKATVTGRAGR